MRRALIIACLGLVTACGDDPTYFDFADAGATDTGRSDAGSADAGGSDAAGVDAASDAGGSDVTGRDVGGEDASSDAAGPSGELVDPGCTDGAYREALPPSTADLSAAIAGFDSADIEAFTLAALDARYPTGASLVRQGLQNQSLGDCIELFSGGATGSASAMIGRLSTIVHECGHFADLGGGSFTSDLFIITDELSFTCNSGDTTDRGGRTFARSLIMRDDYAGLRPACDGGFGNGCDSYADIYLDGDPFDGTFDSGDQGFNALIEEAVQYVNSLATGYAFVDQLGGGSVSERDGILTFLWYIERYLAYARTEEPDAYAFLLGDSCYRDLILTVWGRGWLYLEATEPFAGTLGIDDDALEALVREPALLAEIDAVREASGCL